MDRVNYNAIVENEIARTDILSVIFWILVPEFLWDARFVEDWVGVV